jgi:hypothetical protein
VRRIDHGGGRQLNSTRKTPNAASQRNAVERAVTKLKQFCAVAISPEIHRMQPRAEVCP